MPAKQTFKHLTIETFDELVAALGGTNKCARLLQRAPAEVCHWRKRHGTFPAELFPKIGAMLVERGYGGAPMHLFRFERSRAG